MGEFRITEQTEAAALAGSEQLPVAQLSSTVFRTGTTISASSVGNVLYDSANGWLTAGFAGNQQVNVSGWTGGSVANNLDSATIVSVTANALYLDVALTSASAGDNVTVRRWMPRKVSLAGRLKTYFDTLYASVIGVGDVVGPASATANAVALFDGTTGKLIKDSTATISADGTLAGNSDGKLPTEKAVKAYVDGKVAGLSWKQAVRAATTVAGTLATSFENGDSIDGVTLATGDRILIKDQVAGAENGIYTVNASGAPTRATDADSGSELVNASVYVSEGTANADRQYTCTTNAPITVGSTTLAFVVLNTGSGDVAGPASAVNNNIAVFDGTTGKLIKDGGATVASLDTATQTHAASSKATPVDADEVPLVDSAASNVLKRLTWANLKATLKTYFDTLYNGRTFSIGFGFTTTPTASEVLLLYTFAEAVTFPDEWSGSVGDIADNPTASFVLTVQKNGSSVGTVTISTGGAFTFVTTGGTVAFAIGDQMRVVGPSPVDATAANVSITFLGVK